MNVSVNTMTLIGLHLKLDGAYDHFIAQGEADEKFAIVIEDCDGTKYRFLTEQDFVDTIKSLGAA